MINKVEIPKVSVIITVYNGEKYILETLQSIASQDYSNIEIIIIDDGSTDNTAKLVNDFNVPIVYELQQHAGIATGWNRGVEKATGEYISFLDSDDLWSRNKTRNQVEFLKLNPHIDILFGYAKEFRSQDVAGDHKEMEPVPGISACTMMIKKEKFLEVGLFNTKWAKGIFSDWYLRATEASLKMYVDKQIVLYRRIHDTNHGILQRDKYVDYVRMLKESLDRKRR